jgi:hypothetical protein
VGDLPLGWATAPARPCSARAPKLAHPPRFALGSFVVRGWWGLVARAWMVPVEVQGPPRTGGAQEACHT